MSPQLQKSDWQKYRSTDHLGRAVPCTLQVQIYLLRNGKNIPIVKLISFNRGLTEENVQLGIISPIGYFKSPIGCIQVNWGLGICSRTMLYQTHISLIPNWLYNPQLWICNVQSGKIWPIEDIFSQFSIKPAYIGVINSIRNVSPLGNVDCYMIIMCR